MSLARWRRRVDRVDAELLRLFNERASAVCAIAEWKREQGAALYDPSREAEILRRMRRVNSGPLDGATVTRLFERMIDEFRSFERTRMQKERRRKKP